MNSTFSERFQMNSLANSVDGMLQFHQDDRESAVQPKTMTIELNGDEFWPLSGKPYFHVMITKSNLKALVVPTKFHSVLPPHSIPTSMTYRGKKWEMIYNGKGQFKRINTGWREFAVDNNLKIGDACVFELMDCCNEIVKLNFRVQILRCNIPSKFLHEMNGESADTPIDIE